MFIFILVWQQCPFFYMDVSFMIMWANHKEVPNQIVQILWPIFMKIHKQYGHLPNYSSFAVVAFSTEMNRWSLRLTHQRSFIMINDFDKVPDPCSPNATSRIFYDFDFPVPTTPHRFYNSWRRLADAVLELIRILTPLLTAIFLLRKL